jgi:hypothetical protein
VVTSPPPAGPAPSTLALSLTASPSVYGQQVRAEATVTSASGSPAGSVQFAVDGTATGGPVAVAGGRAVSGPLTDAVGRPLEPGAHVVSAAFTPAAPATDGPASASATQVVDRAGSALDLTATRSGLRAAVTGVAPGAGTATGAVDFYVGGEPVGRAALVDGVATLPADLASGEVHEVAAAYAGDTHFTGSSASTSVSTQDPTLTATLTSAEPESAAGWYRTPVTVTFSCVEGGAPITGACPSPVVVQRDGVRALTRTITAADGGVATVVVTVRLDRTAPTVQVNGVQSGQTYPAPGPRPRCVAADALSGVDTCRVSVEKDGKLRRYRAVAFDNAGNRTVVRGTYRVGKR